MYKCTRRLFYNMHNQLTRKVNARLLSSARKNTIQKSVVNARLLLRARKIKLVKSEVNGRLLLTKRTQSKRAFTRVDIRNFHFDRVNVNEVNGRLLVNAKFKVN